MWLARLQLYSVYYECGLMLYMFRDLTGAVTRDDNQGCWLKGAGSDWEKTKTPESGVQSLAMKPDCRNALR